MEAITWGLGIYGDIAPVVENQPEKPMGDEMET